MLILHDLEATVHKKHLTFFLKKTLKYGGGILLQKAERVLHSKNNQRTIFELLL